MAVIQGTSGIDRLVGTTGNDTMEGGDGNDRLNGGDGNDTMYGGEGNDYVYGDRGDDLLFGGGGNDTLVGDAGNDVIHGEDGNDGIFGGGGHDSIFGGNGNDTIYGDGGDDVIDGDAGDDKLYGGTGNDRLNGGAGNDILDGGSGDDVLVYEFGSGVDQIIGNSGRDTLELSVSSEDLATVRQDILDFASWLDGQISSAGGVGAHATRTSGESFTFDSMGLTVQAIEGITIIVDGEVVSIESLMNAAPVVAEQQSVSTREDVAVSGVVEASDADGDALSFALAQGPANGTVSIDAETGAFTYTPNENYSGADSFEITVTDANGAAATQRVDVAVAAVADAPELTVSSSIGAACGTTPSGTNAITGTSAGDTLYGTGGDDFISGAGGNDTIYGDGNPNAPLTASLSIAAALSDGDGSETLTITIDGVPDGATLSAGTDTGNGSWTLQAGDLPGLTLTLASPQDVTLTVTATAHESNGSTSSVSETLTLEMGGGDDIIAGGAGNDRIHGGAGTDLLDYSGAPGAIAGYLGSGFAVGGDGYDTFTGMEGIIGSNHSDALYGDNNDNILIGGGGHDALYGAGGDDVIDGGDGDDALYGQAGDDVILDGTGEDDVFGETGNDTIVAANDRSQDYYNGGSGNDTIDFSNAGGGVDVNLGNHQARGTGHDLVFEIENVTGSRHADQLTGDNGVNVIDGGAGDDVINSQRGADVLTGGEGADTFVFHRNDVISGKTHYGIDRITDFGAGDRLDFDGLLSSSDARNLLEHVRVVETDAGSIIQADLGGSAGFVDIALLEGAYGLDLEYMIESGQITA